MVRRRLFTVQTPLGHRVFLARDRWRQFIRFKHPAVAGRESELRSCLSSPFLVRESAKEPEVHLYYALAGQPLSLCGYSTSRRTGTFVVTAYFTNSTKPGKELWKN